MRVFLISVALVLGLPVEAQARCAKGQILRVSLHQCVARNSALAHDFHHHGLTRLAAPRHTPLQYVRVVEPTEDKLAPEPKPYQDRPPTVMPDIPYSLPGSIMGRVYAPNFELLR